MLHRGLFSPAGPSPVPRWLQARLVSVNIFVYREEMRMSVLRSWKGSRGLDSGRQDAIFRAGDFPSLFFSSERGFRFFRAERAG